MTTRADITAAIRALAEELGETPTAAQFEANTEYSRSQAQYRFDSWNDAVRSAGLEPNRAFRSDAKLVWILEDLAADLGRTPTQQDLAEHTDVALVTYQDRFGSWNEALRLAGLEVNQEAELSREQLADAFHELEADLDRAPSQRDMLAHGAHSPRSYQRVWGSWEAAKRELSNHQSPTEA